jgi:predicted nucleotidyltransferase
MHLEEYRASVVLEPFEDVELPQRLTAIQRTRKDSSHRTLELEPASRLRDRRSPEVEVQVEPIVVDPERPGETGGQAEDTLSQARCEVEARLGDAGDVLVREGTILARREHGHARDVHVHGGALQIQEARVEAGEAFGWHRNPTVPKC